MVKPCSKINVRSKSDQKNWPTVQNAKVNEQNAYLDTPTCDYVVAMATLKVVDTSLNIKILVRDEWTTPRSFNIIE